MPSNDVKERLARLRTLLEEHGLSTQEELRDKLEKMDFDITQSTVSRDLRKLGAMKSVDAEGRIAYRLPNELEPVVPSDSLVREVENNGTLIVIHTAVGCANLVARQLDRDRSDDILGTIAGDDTIFVAPTSPGSKGMKKALEAIHTRLGLSDD
jgi:transcriptional regulator of arginine metabolism